MRTASKKSQKKHIVFLNGKFLPLNKAKISILDRGFIFGDGVYEVVLIRDGMPLYLYEHLKRLRTSLRAIYCSAKINYSEITQIISRLLRLNCALCGCYSLYFQITRGVDADRNRQFSRNLTPTIFMLLKPIYPLSFEELRCGKAAITAEDIRWRYCHIKSISLLPTLLLVNQAFRANCEETIVIREGKVLEGTSSNVFVVKNGKIFTPLLSEHNLSGVTRDLILKIARRNGMAVVERAVSVSFLRHADEVWISSSTRGIYPIVKLDGKKIGNGKAGPVWEKINSFLL